jgi:hypothetical protein
MPETDEPRYLDMEMPEYFRLEIFGEGKWWNQTTCYRRDFVRLDNGGYLCRRAIGSPIWIRCIAHWSDFFIHIDGDGNGDVFRYRLIPLPMPNEGT